MTIHQPVMVSEVLEFLRPERGGVFVDVTVGTGGHTAAIAAKYQISNVKCQIVGIDQDAEALQIAAERLAASQYEVKLLQGNFRYLDQMLDQAGISQVNGIVADLGLSSLQLETARRGFSFLRPGPLDMRFGGGSLPAGRQGITAEEIINQWSEEKLAALFWAWGEERRSRAAAQAIAQARAKAPIETTVELASVIEKRLGRRGRLHPATKIFQALRIAVNDELTALEEFLPQAARRLAPGGRLVVITYHSLEDRLVKQFLRQEKDLLILTKHVIRPGRDEVTKNPRARSAKLRAAERLGKGA